MEAEASVLDNGPLIWQCFRLEGSIKCHYYSMLDPGSKSNYPMVEFVPDIDHPGAKDCGTQPSALSSTEDTPGGQIFHVPSSSPVPGLQQNSMIYLCFPGL